MAGAYVMVLGMDIAGTSFSDLEDCGHVVRFMQSIDYAGMSPDDELASGATEYVLAAPQGNYVLCTPAIRKAIWASKASAPAAMS